MLSFGFIPTSLPAQMTLYRRKTLTRLQNRMRFYVKLTSLNFRSLPVCGHVWGREGSRRCKRTESYVFVKCAKEEVCFCILLQRASSLLSAARSPKLRPASAAGDLALWLNWQDVFSAAKMLDKITSVFFFFPFNTESNCRKVLSCGRPSPLGIWGDLRIIIDKTLLLPELLIPVCMTYSCSSIIL